MMLSTIYLICRLVASLLLCLIVLSEISLIAFLFTHLSNNNNINNKYTKIFKRSENEKAVSPASRWKKVTTGMRNSSFLYEIEKE